MSRTVHLHPAVIVVALAAGGVLGGIVGVFLAVPVAGGRVGRARVFPRPVAARVVAGGRAGDCGLSRV
jgi:putative heme transporter